MFGLSSCQSAYIIGQSTETVLVKVQSDILLNMDQQKDSQLFLINLSSAFYTVDHDMLLNIMNCTFAVSSTALSWLNSYHQSRSQRICINGTVSEKFKFDHDVPQGSCLRPVEFTEYSSPVFSIIDEHGKLGHAYADDHQVYCSCESME